MSNNPRHNALLARKVSLATRIQVGHQAMAEILVALLVSLLLPAAGDVVLPSIISDNMVLQRNTALPIWGHANPDEFVTVKIGTNTVTATTGQDGRWKAILPAMAAGGPHVITVTGKNTLTVENILVGEVWLCSGQSNMEWPVSRAMNPRTEIRAANHPQVRLFHVPKLALEIPADDVNAAWRVCSSNTIAGFSAVSYFFARHVRQDLNVPFGLINSSWGGTRIEPWTPPEGYKAVPALIMPVSQKSNADATYRKVVTVFLDKLKEKVAEHLPPAGKQDADLLDDLDTGTLNAVISSSADDDDFRMEVKTLVPEDPMRKHALRIKSWIPKAKDTNANGEDLPPLSGGWPRGWPVPPVRQTVSPRQPTALYNGMIYPLIPFALRGAIWYQGESNRLCGSFYHERMKGLIRGWRKVWGNKPFPFYYVQLAPYRYGGSPLLLPEIWEAQCRALSEPETGMAVITDIGNIRNIHPVNKQEVGRRLALLALAKTYGKTELTWSGPMYKSMTIEGNKIQLRFDHVGSGLAARNNKTLTWFAVAGQDREFKPAAATIVGIDCVEVFADGIDKPVAARFGWHQEAEPSLVNSEQLPASPFRTDLWPRQEDK